MNDRCSFGTSRYHGSIHRRAVQLRNLHVEGQAGTQTSVAADPVHSEKATARALPLQCFGCGALSQSSRPNEAGYFDLDRRAVRQYLGTATDERPMRKDDQVLQRALRSIEFKKIEQLGVDLATLVPEPVGSRPVSDAGQAPLCARCHLLVHHHSGTPIFHPSIESLRETIEESPYQHNHIYHILDAADFPMSLLPNLNHLLGITPLRSKNRRARTGDYHGGRKTEMSFVITRADLLAPQKHQIDSLMPYLRETLRDALGRFGRNVRLGNVRCVSAKRSWWTRELKEEIWDRGGAGWLVGKVNVGKSQLFEAVFPKGRMDWKSKGQNISVSVFSKPHNIEAQEELTVRPRSEMVLDESSLLPPVRPETNYPAMPLVSTLPGTTASPIRVPFGNGKGELIDLPGLPRSDLELYVREEERNSFLMTTRVIVGQQVLKPGQSLLLGGLIRITPRTPDLIFLAYAFTPLKPHLTATDKAIAIQEQVDGSPDVESIARTGTGGKIRHAGSFQLRYDVTNSRAGPITRKDAVNISVDRLPFRVLAIDVLVEGCGWIEVVAQMRTRHLFGSTATSIQKDSGVDVARPHRFESLDLSKPESEAREPADVERESGEPNWPVIDVFSPEGRFIGSRRPMNAWLLNRRRGTDMQIRPRRSMKGVKKESKRARRAIEDGEGGNVTHL